MYRLLGSALALGALARPLAAQGWIEIERPPVPRLAPPEVVRVSSDVRVEVLGRVVRVEVEERFRNNGSTVAEGTYLYPLPGEAAFQNFSLWMGEQELRGEMMNAEQARGIYEAIVRRRKDPALLTLAGHGLVRAQVFPFQPGETRRVVLRYTQLSERAGDALRVRYPMGHRGEGNPSVRVLVPDETQYGVPYSPTHEISTHREGGRLEVRMEPRSGSDFEILLPLRRGLVGTTVLTHAPGGEDGYFLLLLAPPAAGGERVVPRDIAFVVDVSGSMSGAKLEQARAALRQALETLRAEDRFRLIAFSTGLRQFREGYVTATRENLEAARAFVDALGADGGTNIAGALEAVLGTPVSEERLPIVLLLTDGIPSVGEQQPDRIAALAAGRIGRTRIFTFGIGPDVNTYLLDRLAREGRGAAEYVSPGASVEASVGKVMAKIRHPALVNLRIVDAPVRLTLLAPAELPDLFFGEELVVLGRYEGHGRGSIVIEGERLGRAERLAAEAVFPAGGTDNDFIPRLWAARRIGDLTRQIRLEGARDALVQEVRELGLRHGILTDYTSYLVQEPGEVALQTGQLRELAAAPEPAAQTGIAAFRRAKESADLAGASSLARAETASEQTVQVRHRGGVVELRRAGGRLFRQVHGVWMDAAHRDNLGVIAVAPYSEAYFALVRALPELARYFTVGDEVLVAGAKVSIQVTPQGAAQLSAQALSQVVKGFRGTGPA
jgi:Ca-activated chloride channel family protein